MFFKYERSEWYLCLHLFLIAQLVLLAMTSGEMLYNNNSSGSRFENNITDCYDSLALLQAAMDNRADVFLGGIVNYTLCPNTFIVLDEQETRTFLVPRINSRIRCGRTGRSSNNCTLSGGKTQVSVLFESLEVYQNNFVIEGLTFESSRGASSFLAAPGVIEYHDCVFKVSDAPLACSSSWQ